MKMTCLRNRALLTLSACLAASAIGGPTGNSAGGAVAPLSASPRTRVLIDDDWRFTKGDPPNITTSLDYDVRPQPVGRGGAVAVSPSASSATVTKSWILPSGNAFLKDPSKRAVRPEGNLGDGVSYVAPGFDDSAWQRFDVPHDYGAAGSPFDEHDPF